jgi:hypothetical protein
MNCSTFSGPQSNRIIDETRVYTEASSEPLDLCAIKDQLLITGSDYDNYLNLLLPAVRRGLEEFCAISIRQRTVKLMADLYKPTELPYGPVVSITSVTRKTGTNTWTPIVVNEDYEYDSADTVSFGQFKAFTEGRYKIVYTAGYANIPEDLLLDLKRLIAYMFENRGDEKPATITRNLDDILELFAGKYRRLTWL